MRQYRSPCNCSNQLHFRNEFTAKFFSPRIVKLWNSLPLEIRSIVCVNKKITPFKTTLYKLYICMHKLSTTFDIDNLCTWVSCCRCPACRPLWCREIYITKNNTQLLTIFVFFCTFSSLSLIINILHIFS